MKVEKLTLRVGFFRFGHGETEVVEWLSVLGGGIRVK